MTLLASFRLALLASAFMASASQAATVATFDDLDAPPALNSATGLQWTNATSNLLYQGALWDARFAVVGDQYAVGTGGPLFGIAHSGHYFVTNQDGGSVTITTGQVLTGAWFGRNQYYGYGEGGADQVTIVALAGASELGMVVFDLPDSHPGQPEPLSFVDTGAFAALNGITGYRIDRRELGSQSGHWVADDFQFEAARALPEPGTAALLLGALGALLIGARRRSSSSSRLR